METAVCRFPDYRSELTEQQPENGLALAFGAAQVSGLVMSDGAGGAAIDVVVGRKARIAEVDIGTARDDFFSCQRTQSGVVGAANPAISLAIAIKNSV